MDSSSKLLHKHVVLTISFLLIVGLLVWFLFFRDATGASNVSFSTQSVGNYDAICDGDEIPESECYALVDLYESLDGENRDDNDNWLEDNEPCDREGVYCSRGHVVVLSLRYNDMTGEIPPSISDLKFMRRLSMKGNDISGPIPKEIGSLQYMYNLDLSKNELCGMIPDSMLNLRSLRYLKLDDNRLMNEGYSDSMYKFLNYHRFDWDDQDPKKCISSIINPIPTPPIIDEDSDGFASAYDCDDLDPIIPAKYYVQLDYNDDGKVDDIDTEILLSMLGKTADKCPEGKVCDFDQNGQIQNTDYQLGRLELMRKKYSTKYDYNDDGKIDFMDYAGLNSKVGLPADKCWPNKDCDLDDNGQIQNVDIQLYRELFKGKYFSEVYAPGKDEYCGDGIDNDCSGVIDNGCPIDMDQDGFVADYDNDDEDPLIPAKYYAQLDYNDDGKVDDLDHDVFVSLIGRTSDGCPLAKVCDFDQNGQIQNTDYQLGWLELMRKKYSTKYDYNNDGKIDSQDYYMLIQKVGLTANKCWADKDCDLDDNGQIQNVDLHLYLDWLRGKHFSEIYEPGSDEYCDSIDNNANGRIDEDCFGVEPASP